MTCESYLPAWSNSFKEIPLKGIQGWFGQRRVTKYIFYDICVSERNSKRGQEMPECSCGATFHELMLVSLFVKSVRADFRVSVCHRKSSFKFFQSSLSRYCSCGVLSCRTFQGHGQWIVLTVASLIPRWFSFPGPGIHFFSTFSPDQPATSYTHLQAECLNGRKRLDTIVETKATCIAGSFDFNCVCVRVCVRVCVCACVRVCVCVRLLCIHNNVLKTVSRFSFRVFLKNLLVHFRSILSKDDFNGSKHQHCSVYFKRINL